MWVMPAAPARMGHVAATTSCGPATAAAAAFALPRPGGRSKERQLSAMDGQFDVHDYIRNFQERASGI